MSSASARPGSGSRAAVKQEDSNQAGEVPSNCNGAGPSTDPTGPQAGGVSAAAGPAAVQSGQGGAAAGPLGSRPSGQTPQGRLLARADTAYSAEWTSEEQATLDALAAKLSAEKYKDPLERALRIAAGLKRKNVRDVALRLRWVAIVQANKKRKLAAAGLAAESDAKKQQKAPGLTSGPKLPPQGPLAPFQATAFAPGGPATLPPLQPLPMLDDHGGASVGGIGGPIGQLLDQNLAYLNQFRTNMQCFKVNENTDLLVRFRDNILNILQQMNGMQGVMSQMPPLPVRLNVELANNFLPKAGTPPLFMGMPPLMAPMPPGGLHNMGVPMNSCYMMPGMPPGMRMPMPMGTMSSGFPQGSHGLTGLPQGIPGMVPAPTGAPQQSPLQSNMPQSNSPAHSSFPVSFPAAPTANGPPTQPSSFPASYPPAATDGAPQNGTPRSGSGQSSKDGKGGAHLGSDLVGFHQQQQQHPLQSVPSLQSAPLLGQDLPGYLLGSQLGMSLNNPPTSQQQQQLHLQQQLMQMGGGLGADGGMPLSQQQWGQQSIPNLHVNPGTVKLEPADTSTTPHQSQESSQGPPAAASAPQLNPQLQQWQLQQNGPALGSGDQPQQQQQQQMSLLQFHQQQMQLQWMQEAQHAVTSQGSGEAKQGLQLPQQQSQQQQQQPLQQQQQQQSQQQVTPASLAQLQAPLQA
ncbi:hypothetical protein WJX74_002231 [Apatococcus lobatus]|uniref:Myb-like domain-containing protein n=1 Tax=Apatococcus lobatus TaxID=904363 RepID=A0AAW1RQ79_9CHLO